MNRTLALGSAALLFATGTASAEPTVIRTTPKPVSGHNSSRAHPPAEIDPKVAPTHPEAATLPWAFTTAWGAAQVMVGLHEHQGTWTASADLDGDGKIVSGERAILKVRPGGRASEHLGTLSGTQLRADATAGGAIRKVPAALEVGVRLEQDGSVTKLDGVNAQVRGTLPNGAVFALLAHGAVFDTAKAMLVVDETGDGHPDFENQLAAFTVADGVVEARGGRWAFAVAPDGSVVQLRPTDTPLPGLRAGSPAPPFSLQASDGATHTLEQYRGKPLLLDFWATWCAPCIEAHPEVLAFAERHGLTVLGVSADAAQPALNAWLRKHPMPWPSAAIGPTGAVNLAYGVNSWPTHALIDAEGKLVVLGSLQAARGALGDL